MKHEELKKLLVEDKKILKEVEFDEEYNKRLKEFTEAGVEKEQAEEYALLGVRTWVKKELRKAKTPFSLVIFGAREPNDYGAQRQFKEAQELWQKDPQDAISKGFCSREGQPLYRKGLPSKIGTPINLQKDKERTILCFAKKDTEDNKEEWKLAESTLGYMYTTDLKSKLPFFTVIKVDARILKKTTDELYYLGLEPDEDGAISFDKTDETVDMPALLSKYTKDKLQKLTKIEDWLNIEQNKKSRDAFVVTKAILNNIRYNSPRNYVDLDHGDFDVADEENKVLSATISEDLPLDVVEGAIDVFVIGRPYYSEYFSDNRMTVYGIWAKEIFRKEKKIQSVATNPEQKVVEDSDTFDL